MKTLLLIALLPLACFGQTYVVININGATLTSLQINTNAPPPAPPVTNNVIYALSGFYPDVTNALYLCPTGGTVVIPAGTFWWAQTVNLSGKTLAGMGTNSTVIRDETPLTGSMWSSAGTPIMALVGISNNLTCVSNIYFLYGLTNNKTTYPGNYGREVLVAGTPYWRINNCKFDQLSGKDVSSIEDSFGVVDHCTFAVANSIALEVFGAGYGDSDWASPTTFGSSNAVYFENNTLLNVYGGDNGQFGWVDVSNGGRAVFRYCNFVNCFMNTHGMESSGRYRSARYVEVYNNVFTNTHIGNFNNIYIANDIRGGGALIFSNSIYGYNGIGFCRSYRANANPSVWAPWYGATGLSAWDTNGPLVLSGTASTTSNALYVAGSLWTNNQYVGCTVYNANNTYCGIVSGNNADTMTFEPTSLGGYQITFNTGDVFLVHRIGMIADQPGAGQCDLLTNLFNPTPVYLNFKTNTIYSWTNYFVRYANNIGIPQAGVFGTDGTCPNLVEGMAFSNNVAKPGYTPFTYPHPNIH